jgi:demethylspheroidene O-methyltransferase
MAGFVYSQALAACVQARLLEHVRDGARTKAAVALRTGLGEEAAGLLLNAATALGLIESGRGGFRLARLGATFLSMPALRAAVEHHRLLYRDLEDPLAVLRGEAGGAVAGFWPYAGGGEVGAEAAASYSAFMAATQDMVAEAVLFAVPLGGVRRLMDVGGGTGRFLAAAARMYPDLGLTLFDLPSVVAAATPDPRIDRVGGDFRREALPTGADAISLVRVLFDHDDATVARLLGACAEALPKDGLIVVAEPMSGGARPERFSDVYFALYTRAMRTGRVRSPARIVALLEAAGFGRVAEVPTALPFAARVVTGCRL